MVQQYPPFPQHGPNPDEGLQQNQQHQSMTNAIVVSGSTHALGVVRSLGEKGVPVTVVSYDSRDIATSSKFTRDVIPAPHPDKDEAQFVKVLLEAAHRFPGSLLIPASDAALGAVDLLLDDDVMSELDGIFPGPGGPAPEAYAW